MTKMFDARRRHDVLDRLEAFFKADAAISGLILVGSSAEETPDNFSGLDLLVVVANGAVFPSVFRKWHMRIKEVLPVSYDFEVHSGITSATLALMLEDYLEINLYFMPFKNLFIDQAPWQLLFDQTPNQEIATILENTYTRERIAKPSRNYQQLMDSIWQPIVKCVAALNRDELWRAHHMLEEIRNHTIELAAMNYDLDMRNFAEIDQLPEMLLIQLRHTIPTNIERIAIRRALHSTSELFFEQASLFEQGKHHQLADPVRQKMMLYLQAYA